MITVSVVSHNNAHSVCKLLVSLENCPQITKILVTLNVPEEFPDIPEPLSEKIQFLKNEVPHGFAKNHNNAFVHCVTPYFCVLNPDVQLDSDPFPVLVSQLSEQVVLSAPCVLSHRGTIIDNARKFPSKFDLLIRLFSRKYGAYTYKFGEPPLSPDWVAGMFMLFTAKGFRDIGGFDESYFLYCEDLDLCVRLRDRGFDLRLCPQVLVVHDGVRASHKQIRHLCWHINSYLRYFTKHS